MRAQVGLSLTSASCCILSSGSLSEIPFNGKSNSSILRDLTGQPGNTRGNSSLSQPAQTMLLLREVVMCSPLCIHHSGKAKPLYKYPKSLGIVGACSVRSDECMLKCGSQSERQQRTLTSETPSTVPACTRVHTDCLILPSKTHSHTLQIKKISQSMESKHRW